MCTFKIDFKGLESELVEKANKAITRLGGEVNGSKFTIPLPLGEIVGNYTIEFQCATFVIVKKPMLLSCKLMESTLKNYLIKIEN